MGDPGCVVKPRKAPADSRLEDDSPGSVVDVFCGLGGLAYGLKAEGFGIAAGIDIDERCRFAFETNTGARFLRRSVEDVTTEELSALFVPKQPRILVGCAPCQPFSVYNQKNDDPNWHLLEAFASIVARVKPDVVSMENVPRLLKFRGGAVIANFCETLERLGYEVSYRTVFCPDYGLPQRRSRLVLLASLHGPLELEAENCAPGEYRTVADAIGHLPALAAGEADAQDSIHVASGLSAINLKRIRASTPGGTWADWPDDLVAKCHQKGTGSGYVSVYGRMRWDEPAPTITTQFYGFGNGRFGHPDQDRAISLREGALLQSFPMSYRFAPPGHRVEMATLGRMVGNAVPIVLALAIARSISRHLADANVAPMSKAD